MKIRFYVRFHTNFGQSLSVSGNHVLLGNNDVSKSFPLTYLNEELWHGVIELPEIPFESINYRYILHNENRDNVIEWGNDRCIEVSKILAEEIQVVDTWNHAGEFENAFYTQPFQKVFLKSHSETKARPYRGSTHVFKVKAPLLKKNEVLCLTGNSKIFGDWKTDEPLLMNKEGSWWVAKVNLSKETLPLSYKYGVYNSKKDEFVQFENGNNRVIYDANSKKKLTILHDGFAQLPNNTWKGAGIAIPVFSLKTKNSFGVGEFTDIRVLVDWSKKIGLKLIQLLPINDTTATHTWTDSYPYAAISAFALHPIFLNLEQVAGKEYAELIKSWKHEQKELNDLPEVDYEKVMNFKLKAIKELYVLKKDSFVQEEKYVKFFNENKHWLIPYAAFCYLRDKNGTADFNQWKANSVYDKEAIEKLSAPSQRHYSSIAFYYFTQYYLHLQLIDAVSYAHKNGIVLKGDIPIGIYRFGCDAWVKPELYHIDSQAGAPPDDFAIKGQNWGFPTYNWEKMAEDGFDWWHKRFIQMGYYFDAFRVDHILGFFRIWSIPMHAVEGILGRFVPAIAIHINEFAQSGLWFDHYRYCNPFINDNVLNDMFGNNSGTIKEYLDATGNGYYELKPEFATQRQVETYFDSLEITDENNRIRYGLYDLISNVILFEEEGSQGQKFHFRISMENTRSFQYLDDDTKSKLKNLYVNYFYKRQDDFWYHEAMKKLPALKRSTNMLICGEDLGMVPACVPDVMKQLGLLSLEIQRMPKDPSKEFFHPNDAPYLSVVTPSTHDMSTIRGWWEEDRIKTQKFYNVVMGQYGDAPFFCEGWVNKAIVLQHLYSPAMWAIFQMQDLLGINELLRRENPNDERINIPANPKHYWRYRMHLTLEQLLKERDFNEELRSYVEASGR
ncbi:MAG TPA: 4-alpha-glucanotransferase [Chitinophagaceae bacterium]|nr:4-alpha-glucanotransferase [Chitinophagaceae bacterium]